MPWSWLLICAIFCISALAWVAELPMSCSTLVRNAWMPCVVELRSWASADAARALDALELAQDVVHLVGIGAARGFRAQLVLHKQIKFAIDAVDLDGRAVGTARDLDLVRVLGDITRRPRVGDVGRDDRQRRLVGAQARHRSGKG